MPSDNTGHTASGLPFIEIRQNARIELPPLRSIKGLPPNEVHHKRFANLRCSRRLQVGLVLVEIRQYWAGRKSAADKPQADGPGDLLLDWGADKMMHIRTYEQSKLNSKAALWTGASVLLQLLAIISGIVWQDAASK